MLWAYDPMLLAAVMGIHLINLRYKEKIKPVEELYKFGQMNSSPLTDADFDAKPQVLRPAHALI